MFDRIGRWRRGSPRRAAAAALALCLAAGPGRGGEDGAATVRAARALDGLSGFMLELDLSRRTPFRAFTLDSPPRVVVDFPRLDWRVPAPAPRAARGLARAMRHGLLDAGTSRIVIDLARPARIASAAFDEGAGARFELLLRPTDAAAFAAAAGWPPGAAPAAAGPPSAPPPDDGRLTVVIDPGHGGVDPGAIRGDTNEKDIALAFARDLRDALAGRDGLRVAMTRDEDVFVSLRDRVRIGAALGGDIFLSVHVNTVEVGDATGASIHTLSDTASDEEAEALAEFENRADILAGVDLEGEGDDVARALIDLAQRRANRRSRRLARELLAALEPVAPLLRGRAHSFAGFRVLKSPDMASALVELGFMSNAQDMERLRDPQWRAKAAAAMADALSGWARTQAARGAIADE